MSLGGARRGSARPGGAGLGGAGPGGARQGKVVELSGISGCKRPDNLSRKGSAAGSGWAGRGWAGTG